MPHGGHLVAILGSAWRMRLPLVVGVVTVFASGCAYVGGYMGLSAEKVEYALHPDVVHERTAEPQLDRIVYGKLERAPRWRGVPLTVAAFERFGEGTPEPIDVFVDLETDLYWMFLPPADFDLLVFADLDGDRRVGADEVVAKRFLRRASIERPDSDAHLVEGIDIEVPAARPARAERGVSIALDDPELRRSHPGRIHDLSESTFGPEMGLLGMYSPWEFLDRFPGFFLHLEPISRSNRIPVLFVHGINDTPARFATLVAKLDRQRFEPWFFYYPSGLGLSTNAELLHRIFLSGHFFERPQTLLITANSMGGVVVREALNRASPAELESVALFVSFGAPYGGLHAATAAVEQSPTLIPAWVDLAEGSEFMAGLFRRPLPGDTRFDLFFAFGASHGDGTIDLESQLAPRAHDEADHRWGFDLEHGGIVTEERPVARYLAILDDIATRHGR